MTELTKQTGLNDGIAEISNATGWVFIDGECPMCVGLARRLERVFARIGYKIAPQQATLVQKRIGLKEGEPLTEVRILTPKGQVIGGADAVVYVARSIWWAWPLFAISRVPGAIHVLRAAYKKIAAKRFCISGVCCGRRSGATAWIPILVLPLIVCLLGKIFAPWMFMWGLALSIYCGCKWLTWRHASSCGRSNWTRHLQYMFCWPGMDASRFINSKESPETPKLREWMWAAFKTSVGFGLIWTSANESILDPVMAGGIVIVGLALMLHFGIFELLGLHFRSRGIQVTQIMCRPLYSTSLAEFWGRRWNTAFSHLTRVYVFRPLRELANARFAMLAGFVVSGLVHDFVISVPAGAGYGMPTVYFLIQAAGVLVQRSRLAKSVGINCGPRGWAFTLAVVLAPVTLLFPPAFVVQVIIPFAESIDWR